MVGAALPVDPDADTARQWLTDELTNPVYHDGPSLLERFLEWLLSLLDGVSVVGLPGVWSAVVVVAAVLAAAAVALAVAGPVRASRRARSGPAVLADDVRTAEQLAAGAAASAARGDFTTATLDAFRALVRRSEERVLLEPRPGRTAHEAAVELTPRFPDHTVPLRDAAAVFDSLFYGKTTADARSYASVADLESALRAERPAPVADRRVLTS
ncbi:DUF4129 domain-containing protein [Sanguibacter sp. 25GB23B1]|uniref:DUF4129 domain-containing protein n=1 Tax=unclassified Sanguibacter TaxID=2645534 RepID=UPI0032AF8F0B